MQKQNPDGSWGPATPLSYMGWKARLSYWCFQKDFWRMANFLAWLDERGLGK